jgi:hypothetical protein
MDSSYIAAAVTWRKRYKSLEELEKESAEYTDLDTEEKKHCDRNIRRRLAAAGWAEEPGRNGLLFTGTLYPSDWESKIRGIIDDCVKELHMRTTLIPASVAAKNMGMSVYQLKQSVRSGTISGIRVDDDLYIDPEVIADYQEEKRGLIGVFDWLKDELPEMGIRTMFDLENRTDRAMLNNMLRQSAAGPLLVSWEQAGFRGDRCNSLYFPSAIQDQVREIITRYLKDFGRREELYTLRRQDPYWRDHQRTLQALDIFERTKTKEKMASLYEIFIAKNFNLQKGVPFFYTNDINYKPYFFIEAIPNYDYITGTIQINYSPLFEGFPNNFYIGVTYNYRTTSYNTRRSLSLKFDLKKIEYSFNFTHVPFHTKTKQLFLEYDFNEIQVIDMTITLDVTANIFELTDGISKTFSDFKKVGIIFLMI